MCCCCITRIVAYPKLDNECNNAPFVNALTLNPDVTSHGVYKPNPVISHSKLIKLNEYKEMNQKHHPT